MLLVGTRPIHGHAATRVIRVLQSDLHAAQQLIRGVAMIRMNANCRCDIELQRHSRKMEARAQDTGKLVSVQGGSLDGAILGDHQKLTLGDAHHNVRSGRVLAHATPRLAHDIVADVMPE